MNIWESIFIQILQKQNLLIEEHKVNDPNPLYELAQDVALRNWILTSGSCLLRTTHTHTLYRVSPSN